MGIWGEVEGFLGGVWGVLRVVWAFGGVRGILGGSVGA